ncbi:hypothetical protein TNCV_2038221 [Trichonephila clavipes]|nr:hypothetical protein TNCV_2038221 [Trichonephila clavipes]
MQLEAKERRRPLIPEAESYVKEVTSKCLGGPSVDRDRLSAHPGSREYHKMYAATIRLDFSFIDGSSCEHLATIIDKYLVREGFALLEFSPDLNSVGNF